MTYYQIKGQNHAIAIKLGKTENGSKTLKTTGIQTTDQHRMHTDYPQEATDFSNHYSQAEAPTNTVIMACNSLNFRYQSGHF